MRDDLRRALAPVLRDLAATGAPTPSIEESDSQTWPGAASAFLRSPDGSGTGVWVDADDTEEQQIAMLAEQVQEWAIEELAGSGRPTNWPPCPDHPRNHPLTAALVAGTAEWTCPTTRLRVSDVGRLAPQPHR